MSFKREGDDSSQLNLLKKRRVADLLVANIAEDEAMLCSNGRLACTVCPHRPVFDTVDVLASHRRGKRHLQSLQKHYGRKLDLKNELLKRKHRAYVEAESGTAQDPAPLLSETRQKAYHALLKSAPYNSCCHKRRVPSDEGSESASGGCSRGAEQRAEARDSPSSPGPAPSPRLPAAAAASSAPSPSAPQGAAAGAERRGVTKSEKCKSKGARDVPCQPADPARRHELEHYLHLKSLGWVRNRDGQWEKDEDVEFDSDEEEPPVIAPLPPMVPQADTINIAPPPLSQPSDHPTPHRQKRQQPPGIFKRR
ncbi:sodium channel modifier 1 isoform X2 [Lethenteron reissneri]|uniref:sodium channel modifier 1 isoform X2 n=1 Tax=Lethenteron reissneri TaxID=7753 RepID=UPI002AB60EA2|nr:sodium channel modifier 1 isoform X2 [Lethenteron reissneri]